MFVSRSWPKPKAVAAVIFGACLMASVFIFDEVDGDDGRRYLQSSESLYPWARTLLRPLTKTPEPSKETVLFWHIPKSGGTTAKTLYKALGKSVDIQSNKESILEAQKKGLVQSGQVDMIFSSLPDFSISHLFDNSHKGRALVLFRHPVDRLISKFYYLQTATWEKTYHPEWKDMDILDWVEEINIDNNHMVKKLAGKVQRDKATETDLRMAMRTVKQRFIVGLMHKMEESVHRFNTVLGIDESAERTETVMDMFFGDKVKKTNSNSHPKVEKGNPAWDLLAEQNALDIKLYEYVRVLFQEQKEIIDSYRTSFAITKASKEKFSTLSCAVVCRLLQYSEVSVAEQCVGSRWRDL